MHSNHSHMRHEQSSITNKKSPASRPNVLVYLFYGLFGLLTLLITLVGLCTIAYCTLPPFPSDNELISRFDSNRSDFEKILKMSREEKETLRITKYPLRNMAESRQAEYHAAFRKIGLYGIDRDLKRGNVFFLVATKLNSDVKGYAHLHKRPHVIKASLDDPLAFWCERQDPDVSERATAFRELQDGWYIWREVNYQ